MVAGEEMKEVEVEVESMLMLFPVYATGIARLDVPSNTSGPLSEEAWSR
jgi:hypothetical protein